MKKYEERPAHIILTPERGKRARLGKEDAMDDYFILIPAYEPDERLLELVEELRGRSGSLEANLHVLVVDDGSRRPEAQAVFRRLEELAGQAGPDSDSMPETGESRTKTRESRTETGFRLMLLRHPQNRGKGAALRTGLAYLRRLVEKPGVVVLMDADGQHRPDDALHLAHRCLYGANGLYLGSRHFSGEIPLRSKLGNRLTCQVFALVTGQKVSDTQTGLRAFCTAYIPKMCKIGGERYEYEMRMLLEFAGDRVPIYEIPIETIYENNNAGSHFHAVRDSIRIYRVIFEQIISFAGVSLASFGLDYLLYALMTLMIPVVGANVLARLISAAFNYSLNRKLVFHHRGRLGRSLSRYALTAVLVLCADTCLVYGLTALGLGALTAKLIAEPTIFIFSYLVQKNFVFVRKEVPYVA